MILPMNAIINATICNALTGQYCKVSKLVAVEGRNAISMNASKINGYHSSYQVLCFVFVLIVYRAVFVVL